jgi:hypothetical protein
MRGMRWSRFSLRTLLIFTTAAALFLGWLGWQRHIVRERFEWSQTINARGGGVYFHMGNLSLPWYRRMYSDRAVAYIHLYPNCSTDQKAIITSLFPEAKAIQDNAEPDLPPSTL